jgi:NAD(P)-dependent dehydrogenase (short-subunit alcohol dehydrogenase family)
MVRLLPCQREMAMEQKLQDRVALVTGGARGLGRVIALRLAREGADVCLAAPEADELEATAAAVRALGRRALPVRIDVTREDQVASLVGQVQQAFGQVDLLVNNAGIAGPTVPVTHVGRADWDQVLAVNLTGMFLCCKHVLPLMLARRSGKIVNISSIAGKIAYALRAPYAASKWGVIGLTLAIAKEVGEHNIQVNAVCPGPVEGERIRRVIEARAQETKQSLAEVERSYREQTLLKRLVSAEDVAALVAFLASSEADNITGQALDVSAGYGL